MINKDYIAFCNHILSDWKENELSLQDNYGFDLDALPEPYLTFGKGNNQMCFLTTNPGGVMNFQRRKNHYSPTEEPYTDLSIRLGQHYEKVLNGAAKIRIENMYEISKKINPDTKGFTQLEISPFHSSNFPNKEKFAKDILNDNSSLHAQYVEKLRAYLLDKNCICIQSGYPDIKRLNKNWLILISKILNVETKDWNTLSFRMKNGRATTGAFFNKNKNGFKAILFNSASNSCPKIDSMHQLFDRIKAI